MIGRAVIRTLALFGMVMLLGEALSLARADGPLRRAPHRTRKMVLKKHGSSRKKTKRHVTIEKSTEGTEAPDRFKAPTVIKSQYKLDGQQLEVDPD